MSIFTRIESRVTKERKLPGMEIELWEEQCSYEWKLFGVIVYTGKFSYKCSDAGVQTESNRVIGFKQPKR